VSRRDECPHCEGPRAKCGEPCERAEKITQAIRAKGCDAVSVRDAVHEAHHAITWGLKGKWTRENIDRKNPNKARRNYSFGVRDEITARAVEWWVVEKLGLVYDLDKWAMMMIMEALKIDHIALPGFDWAKEGIQLRKQSKAVEALADDIIARFENGLEPCAKCGAGWTIFHGGEDAGMVHNPGCPGEVKPKRKRKSRV
jgi:hypothetical protein